MVKCHKCNYVYDPGQSYTALPSNFQIAGIPQKAELPQCPNCENIDFFGLHEKVK